MGKTKRFDELIEAAEGIKKDSKPKKDKKKVKGGKLATPATYDFGMDVNVQMELESLENHFFPKTAVVEDESFILDSLLGENADTHLIDALAEGTMELAEELLKCKSDDEISKWNKRLVKRVMSVLKDDEKFAADYPTKELRKEAEKMLSEYVDSEDFRSQLKAVIDGSDETETPVTTINFEDDGESVFLLSEGLKTIYSGHATDLPVKPRPSMAEIVARKRNDRSPGLQRYYALRSELKMPC